MKLLYITLMMFPFNGGVYTEIARFPVVYTAGGEKLDIETALQACRSVRDALYDALPTDLGVSFNCAKTLERPQP